MPGRKTKDTKYHKKVLKKIQKRILLKKIFKIVP